MQTKRVFKLKTKQPVDHQWCTFNIMSWWIPVSKNTPSPSVWLPWALALRCLPASFHNVVYILYLSASLSADERRHAAPGAPVCQWRTAPRWAETDHGWCHIFNKIVISPRKKHKDATSLQATMKYGRAAAAAPLLFHTTGRDPGSRLINTPSSAYSLTRGSNQQGISRSVREIYRRSSVKMAK